MEFDFFMPSQKVLDFIGWDGSELCQKQYTIFFQPFEPERTLPVVSLTESIQSYFFLSKEIRPSNWNDFILQKLGMRAAWEAIKNCQDHSGFYTKNPITFGLFFAPNGVCYGFHDGGDYFKRPEIKDQWENKKRIKDFDLESHRRREGGGAGVNHFIYPYVDLIEVDAQKGILYFANTLEGKI